MVEKNFQLTQLNVSHSHRDMRVTYAALAAHMEKFKHHQFCPGRKTNYSINDIIDEGLDKMSTKTSQEGDGDDEEGDEGEMEQYQYQRRGVWN